MYNINSYSTIKTDKTGKRYLSQILLPEIPVSDSDFFIISSRGDRLDLFAERYLGSSELWIIIAQANNLGKGTLVIEPGMQIRIPSKDTIDKILQDFKNLQKV